jgi:hypothetical protein
MTNGLDSQAFPALINREPIPAVKRETGGQTDEELMRNIKMLEYRS